MLFIHIYMPVQLLRFSLLRVIDSLCKILDLNKFEGFDFKKLISDGIATIAVY